MSPCLLLLLGSFLLNNKYIWIKDGYFHLLDIDYKSETDDCWLQQMTELDVIDDNKYNGNFHLEENFHQLVTVDNQDIFDVEGEIERRFSADYTLASW